MSFLNQKIQITAKGTYQWWVIVSDIIFGLMVGSLLLSAIFVYNYTFRTLEDAHTIVLLNTDMVVNNINVENYQKAVSLLSLKTPIISIPDSLRNIFSYKLIPTTTPESSTSTYVRP